MGEFLSKEKVNELLNGKPQGFTDKQILQRLLDRGYELEGLNAEFSPIETVKNIPGSLASFGKAIWSAVVNIDQTVNALDSVAGGAARKFWKAVGVQPKGYSEDDEGNFEAMVDFFVQRYGSTDKLLNTIEQDPVGFLSDASVVLSGGGALLKGAGTVGKLTPLVKTGEAVTKYARILEPATAVVKGTRRLNRAIGLDRWANRLTRDLTGATKTFIKDVGIEGREFLNKHGISGSLDQMSQQLEKVGKLTKGRVDELLASVPGKFRNQDTLSLLNEEMKIFAKSGEDIVEGADIIKVKTKAGTKAKQIPYKQREPLSIPKDNLSEESLGVFNRIKELRQKYIAEGLTLSEMNEVKRLSDQTLSIFKRTIGETKATVKAEELGRLRVSTQKFIENTAENAGITNIRKLNKQTQLSRAWKDVIDERILVGRERLPLWERLTLIGATTGTVVGGGLAGGLPGLLASIGLVGAIGVSRIPRIRTFLINRISLMTKTEFDRFLGEVDAFRKTQKLGRKLRQIREEAMRYARPAGIVEQKAEEQQRIPIRTQ